MKTITIEEFKEACSKHWPDLSKVEFICPKCGTVQTADDLIEAGAGKTFEEVSPYLAFSCVGRWSDTKGCNWTLGGLFKIHTFEIIMEDGNRPTFEVNFPKDDA